MRKSPLSHKLNSPGYLEVEGAARSGLRISEVKDVMQNYAGILTRSRKQLQEHCNLGTTHPVLIVVDLG